jgi:serine/threonine protein kinase/tetratricopeptide (TPR) repeat protein
VVSDKPTVDSIFLAAVELPPDQRTAYLKEACGNDRDLLARVELLLAAQSHVGSFLESPAPELGATVGHFVIEKSGTVIGPYKLLQQIGEGGMGVVFMAEQTAPIQRTVALKIIKPGMDTRQVIARFEAERQALAMMDHPNIAKVLDAGTTEAGSRVQGARSTEPSEAHSDDFLLPAPRSSLPALFGRPFFVMELVKGTPITKYCDEKHLSLRERLDLFIPVCQAVQHAHQKGIIHRDIKPTNVLVADYDNYAVPKVIDFGVAKATAQKLTERTMFTEFGQLVGTFEYMSPEQAKLNQLDIDTRSDIYSLGVLLYELLTGDTPFDRQRLESAAFDEKLRIIREEDPPRPSTRITTLAQQAASTVSAQRSTDPKRLSILIRGELDWIVMKCLDKDRNRRYESASSLAQDVQRHLDDEPVGARPPSTAYRIGKIIRRNKPALAVASSLLLVVFLTIVGLFVNNRLVTREKGQKAIALAHALQEKSRADQNLSGARQAVKEYLLKTSENPLLQSGDFYNLRKELLETAIPFYVEFVRQKQDDPTLEAERGLAYEDLAFLRQETGDLAGAMRELEQAEQIFRRLSATFSEEADYRQRLAEILNSRGSILHDLGRLDEAERSYRQAVLDLDELVEKQPSVSEYRNALARTTNNLGLLLRDVGHLDEAESMLRQAISIHEDLIAHTPAVLELRGQLAQSWVNLGSILYAQRRSKDAEQAFHRALETLDPTELEKLAPGSPLPPKFEQVRAQSLNNVGDLYRADGRFAEAESAFRQALAIKEKLAKQFPSVPQFSQEVARSFSNLGLLFSLLGKPVDAQAAFEKSIEYYERLAADFRDVPDYAVEVAGTYTNLGRLLGDQGQLDESLPILTKSIEILEAARQQDQRRVKVRESLLVARWTRAMTFAGLGRFAEALADWDRAIELDEGHYQNKLTLKRASTFLQMKDYAAATADAQAVAESGQSSGDDLFLAACTYAVSAKLATDDPTLAESYAARAVLLLRQALDKGYETPARIITAPELQALQSREDFRKLMGEVVDEPFESEIDRQQ